MILALSEMANQMAKGAGFVLVVLAFAAAAASLCVFVISLFNRY
jgi:hypothetical protein